MFKFSTNYDKLNLTGIWLKFIFKFRKLLHFMKKFRDKKKTHLRNISKILSVFMKIKKNFEI